MQGNMSKNKPNTLMTHEACESKLRSVVRSSMHPYPGNWVAIGHAVVYYAWAAREFSAGIKCRHCRCRGNGLEMSLHVDATDLENSRK